MVKGAAMDRAQSDEITKRLVERITEAANEAVLSLNAIEATGTECMQVVGVAMAQVYFDLIAANMDAKQTFADTVQTVSALASGSFANVAYARAQHAGITPFSPADLGPRTLN